MRGRGRTLADDQIEGRASNKGVSKSVEAVTE